MKCFVMVHQFERTLGARGFSCAVCGVGHVSIVTRARAGGLLPSKRNEVFPSAAREKKPLVPRVVRARTTTDFEN